MPADAVPELAAALEARSLSKSCPGTLAVDRVDLTVRSGEVHAPVGENGAGGPSRPGRATTSTR